MTTAAPAVPSREEASAAYDFMLEKVGVDTFFSRLGQYGIVPQSEKEAQDLLQLNALLLKAEQAEKTAGDGRFGGSVQRLAGVIEPTIDDMRQSVKSAAARLANDPEIHKNVLLFRQFEAAGVAT